jgi:hypothetical protein
MNDNGTALTPTHSHFGAAGQLMQAAANHFWAFCRFVFGILPLSCSVSGTAPLKPKGPEMGRQLAAALYAVAIAAVIVGLDLAFFRGRFWERLLVNVGIVLVFAAFYLRFFRR